MTTRVVPPRPAPGTNARERPITGAGSSGTLWRPGFPKPSVAPCASAGPRIVHGRPRGDATRVSGDRVRCEHQQPLGRQHGQALRPRRRTRRRRQPPGLPGRGSGEFFGPATPLALCVAGTLHGGCIPIHAYRRRVPRGVVHPLSLVRAVVASKRRLDVPRGNWHVVHPFPLVRLGLYTPRTTCTTKKRVDICTGR